MSSPTGGVAAGLLVVNGASTVRLSVVNGASTARLSDADETPFIPADKRKSPPGGWSKDEVDRLVEGRRIYGRLWDMIATLVGTRTPMQCKSKNQKMSKVEGDDWAKARWEAPGFNWKPAITSEIEAKSKTEAEFQRQAGATVGVSTIAETDPTPMPKPKPTPPSRSTRSLPVGVSLTQSGKFNARICRGSVNRTIGTFETADEASRVYQIFRELFGDPKFSDNLNSQDRFTAAKRRAIEAILMGSKKKKASETTGPTMSTLPPSSIGRKMSPSTITAASSEDDDAIAQYKTSAGAASSTALIEISSADEAAISTDNVPGIISRQVLIPRSNPYDANSPFFIEVGTIPDSDGRTILINDLSFPTVMPLQVGDVLLSVNGTKVFDAEATKCLSSFGEVVGLLEDTLPGCPLVIDVLRRDKETREEIKKIVFRKSFADLCPVPTKQLQRNPGKSTDYAAVLPMELDGHFSSACDNFDMDSVSDTGKKKASTTIGTSTFGATAENRNRDPNRSTLEQTQELGVEDEMRHVKQQTDNLREWWEAIDESSGRPYYYNVTTDEVTWDTPAGFIKSSVLDPGGAVEATSIVVKRSKSTGGISSAAKSKTKTVKKKEKKKRKKPRTKHSAGHKSASLKNAKSELGKNDVAMGRGGLANNHEGNILFRKLATSLKSEYALLPNKEEKKDFSLRLLSRVKDTGGRFMAKDVHSGLFYEVEDKYARRKCSQALREIWDGDEQHDNDEA